MRSWTRSGWTLLLAEHWRCGAWRYPTLNPIENMTTPEAGQGPEQRGASHVATGDLLAGLRARFPKARLHYPPTPNCKRCSGTGVEPPKKLPSGTMLNAGPCACLFFGPNTKEMTGLIAQSARRLLSANVLMRDAADNQEPQPSQSDAR